MLDYYQRRTAVLKGRQQAKSASVSFHAELTQPAGSMLQLASLVEESIVDGPGVRFTVFTQGCPHRCPGCHNPSTHLSVGGSYFRTDEVMAIYRRYPASRGMTLSGGEPFEQAEALAELACQVREDGGDIIVYTGYRWEVLKQKAKEDSAVAALLEACDLLIDGRFMLALKTLEAPFVGSSNQRLIALSGKGNHLLDAIPLPPSGIEIRRIYHQAES